MAPDRSRAAVGGIVLAGGASSRMGRPKALLLLPAGDSFLARLASTCRLGGVDEVIAVVGYHGDLVRLHVDSLGIRVRVVTNPDPSRGQLSSLLAGLDVVDGLGCDGAVVVPVDQPLVDAGTVRAVVSAWREGGAAVVRPRRPDGRHGHPILLDRRTWPDLRQTDLASGARPVVAAWAGECADVDVQDPGAFEDVDTPEDYDRLFAGVRDPSHHRRT